AVGHGYKLSEYAHGSFFNWKGQFYHIWCRYIRDGYKYRESMITYCHMDDNGKIVTDTEFLDQHFSNGVGQYQASWNKIEAEWFYEVSEGIRKRGTKEKGFVLTNIKDGNYIKFANVTFEKKYENIVLQAALNSGKGTLEIRTGSPKGISIGKVNLTSNKSMDEFSEIKCKIKTTLGKEDIYIIFKGNKESTLKLDWIKFLKKTS
ncbi:MAG: carbohydrate-binding protein, partial [Maribacter sp.]